MVGLCVKRSGADCNRWNVGRGNVQGATLNRGEAIGTVLGACGRYASASTRASDLVTGSL